MGKVITVHTFPYYSLLISGNPNESTFKVSKSLHVIRSMKTLHVGLSELFLLQSLQFVFPAIPPILDIRYGIIDLPSDFFDNNLCPTLLQQYNLTDFRPHIQTASNSFRPFQTSVVNHILCGSYYTNVAVTCYSTNPVRYSTYQLCYFTNPVF